MAVKWLPLGFKESILFAFYGFTFAKYFFVCSFMFGVHSNMRYLYRPTVAVRYDMKQKESRAEYVSRLCDIVSGRKPVVGFA